MIYIGQCCSSMCCKTCKCCGDSCQKCCNECMQCHCCPDYARLPFSTCSILFAMALAIPAIVILIYVLSESDHTDHCDKNYIIANVIEFINYVATIAFVIYCVKRIGEGYFKAFEKSAMPNSISKEVMKFVCYDVIVLIFIFFYIWTIVWDCIVFAWTSNENDYCDEEYDGVIAASNFMAAWHLCMTVCFFFFFVIVLCCLSCAENSFARPFVSCCVCGYDNIEKEKRRRRQKALENDQKRMEENKQQQQNQGYNNQQYTNQGYNQPYNPSAPNQYSNNPQPNYYHQQQPPQMNSNPNSQPANPYNSGYNPQPAPYSPQESPTKQVNGPPVANPPPAENKGFFDKAKEKVDKFFKK